MQFQKLELNRRDRVLIRASDLVQEMKKDSERSGHFWFLVARVQLNPFCGEKN
jgi:hypothetical protein